MEENNNTSTKLESKWEGKVSTLVENIKAEQIWSLFKDFFNIHKYFPTLANSYGVHGTNGEVGCIRLCLGSSIRTIPPPATTKSCDEDDGGEVINGGHEVSWSKERLIAVDEDAMSLSYEIVDSNIGFNSYVSTVTISRGGGGGDGDGCVIEWTFAVDPVQGTRFEELVSKYDLGLKRMAKAMKDSLANS